MSIKDFTILAKLGIDHSNSRLRRLLNSLQSVEACRWTDICTQKSKNRKPLLKIGRKRFELSPNISLYPAQQHCSLQISLFGRKKSLVTDHLTPASLCNSLTTGISITRYHSKRRRKSILKKTTSGR